MSVETQNDKHIVENAPFDATHFSDGVYIKVDGSNMFEWVKYTDETEYDWDAVSYDHNGRFLSDIKRLVALQESIENSSDFGDGWYDGFLEAQKLAEDENSCLEDIKEDEIREMSEQAESKHDELKTKANLENEANDFALDLLLPKKSFSDFIENTSQAVADIAAHFQVENKVVIKRANDLGYTLSLPEQTA
jgi:hypothetical protein